MPELWYMIAAVAVAGIITILLRALPFALLKPLRSSRFVKALGRWMPAGLLLILAVVMLSGEFAARPGRAWIVVAAAAVTVLVHLFAGRRALLSIFAGTGVYVLLLNLF
ncbi:AzlD domain-containing protein [Leucobacter weissii]|uniref:AzlD domain-containing protein n=1 Tax=Leucobacter weissii TaxID=1983706 RepID=A0A939S9J2_9MICO|nr:AzlD domain-containing protein [Leucobacter weissii]MBO1900987.1 AzlD domain-containing protein [Leucobacter weissii]